MSLENKISIYSDSARTSSIIDSNLYTKYEVKRGLRDISGKGVLAGLTEISEVMAYRIEEGDLIPCEGRLFYRGYDRQAFWLRGDLFFADYGLPPI